jgi:CheY-like chemotaxis protein
LNQDVLTVLVIEDEDATQAIIEEALTEAGFYPAIAASGEEAVTLLQAESHICRALVTDINLRGKINGWEVARQAREKFPEFPVVYISGASGADWSSKGVPNSIMLQKPFAPAATCHCPFTGSEYQYTYSIIIVLRSMPVFDAGDLAFSADANSCGVTASLRPL